MLKFFQQPPIALVFAPVLWLFFLACQGSQPPQVENQLAEDAYIRWCPGNEKLSFLTTERDIFVFEETVTDIAYDVEPDISTPDLLIAIARKFIHTPYVAQTLETDQDEQLVINLREMDCTTFVEYMLSMTLIIQYGDSTFWDFAQTLACIRYRDGIIDQYPSRLHYFSEWLQNNADKGILTLVSNELGSQTFNSKVHFMSSNPHLYKQLAEPDFVNKMKAAEQEVSSYPMNYIPKNQIENLESSIQDGDIIALTTSIEGLDVSHTGFALHQNGRLHLLHASSSSKQVEISPVPLSDYLAPM
ncbi:MAG: N-acetylmuramoyl-L-alanine amidase-like domain-containing protein, partial [bacterium]